MKKDFWDRNAKRYDRFMKKDAAAYRKMYGLIRPVVKSRTTLELATGTGLIAWNIAGETHTMEATDASPDMIAQAKRESRFPSAKLHFSVQDMFHLPYADGSFDVVIVANALHIVTDQHKAPYTGTIVWKDFYNGLREIGFDGDLSFETFHQTSIGEMDEELVAPWLSLIFRIGEHFRNKIQEN